MLQVLSSREAGNSSGGYLDRRPRLGISAHPRLPLAGRKRSKTDNCDLLSPFQGLGHSINEGVEGRISLRARDFRVACHL